MASSQIHFPHHPAPVPGPDPAMSNTVDRHQRVRLTREWIERDGRPVVPVSGEFHYTRVPRSRWAERLAVMRAAGITIVATYVPWLHHQPTRSAPRFDGHLDLDAFITAAAEAGLEVAIRLGPWCHGEMRNGGLPDWVLEDVPSVRCDAPAYLELVDQWFSHIGAAVAPHCGPSGSVVVIQVENELYDQPDHIRTLKSIARRHGMSAPLWTATAWGGAELPQHEVLPVFAGYSDGFWADQHAGWEDSFRQHFFFSDMWDDPGVGGDQRDGSPVVVHELDPEFPPSTCELGGGMATAYHRRPVPSPEDIAAVANVKLGSGSAWQGFYMFAGGVNPGDDLQESHATAYPNDLPRFDYDFHAAIGAAGNLSDTLALLRQHTMFLASFGSAVAKMPSLFPEERPRDLHDLTSVRCALRSDGQAGFLFLSSHQPHEPLSVVPQVQFSVEFAGRTLVFPDRPTDIPAGVIARWPINLRASGVEIRWCTASAVCLVEGSVPLLVLVADHGVVPRIDLGAVEVRRGEDQTDAVVAPFDLAIDELIRVDGRLDILVIDEDRAARSWLVDGVLVESSASDTALWRSGNDLLARSGSAPELRAWSPTAHAMRPLDLEGTDVGGTRRVATEMVRPSAPVPRFGTRGGRASAPTRAQFDASASVHRLEIPPSGLGSDHRLLTVVWDGDVAELRVDDRTVADRFWDGTPWYVDASSIPDDAVVTMHLLSLEHHQQPDLWPGAAARRGDAGTFGALHEVRVTDTSVWSAVDLFEAGRAQDLQ